MTMPSQNSTIFRPPDEVDVFVLRRAVRFGVVTRSDVLDAFGRIGTTKATLALDYAAAYWPDALERTGKAVKRREPGQVPLEASESQLVECLENGWLEFRRTGLRERELPVERVRWTEIPPPVPGVLTVMVEAIVKQRPVRIRYVGLRQGETARWRLIYPTGLERFGEQWRMIGQDLEMANCPMRTFVLPRVLEAAPVTAKPPDIQQAAEDRLESVPVRFHPQLTDDQRRVLAYELRIRDGCVTLPRRGVFEFMRRFSDQPPSPEAVWPLIFRIEE